MGEVVVALKTKNYEKQEVPFSEQDKQDWSNNSFYFIGGGVMQSPEGEEIRQEATRIIDEELHEEAPQLVTSKYHLNAGIVGATNFVPMEELKKPQTPYTQVLVIDLGGFFMKIGITTVDTKNGEIILNDDQAPTCEILPTPSWEGVDTEKSREQFLELISRTAADTISKTQGTYPSMLSFTCICSTGVIDEDGVVIGTSTFPGWNKGDFQLHKEIEQRLRSRGIHQRVLVVNDAVAAGAANIREARSLSLKQWGYLGLGSSLGGAFFLST
ncbi:MAG: hypothetical protein NT099_05765 [Candidatus Saganbacteria bacterium]|nr:hypothetical protein [Candidatus Saganbacteria bacterium]